MSSLSDKYTWWKKDPRFQRVKLINEIEAELGITWNSLDPVFKTIYIELGGVLRPSAFQRWLNSPNVFQPEYSETPLEMILDGEAEYVIAFVRKYRDTSYT